VPWFCHPFALPLGAGAAFSARAAVVGCFTVVGHVGARRVGRRVPLVPGVRAAFETVVSTPGRDGPSAMPAPLVGRGVSPVTTLRLCLGVGAFRVVRFVQLDVVGIPATDGGPSVVREAEAFDHCVVAGAVLAPVVAMRALGLARSARAWFLRVVVASPPMPIIGVAGLGAIRVIQARVLVVADGPVRPREAVIPPCGPWVAVHLLDGACRGGMVCYNQT
jgi:hypothetical protein